MNTQKFAPLILRAGIAIVFIWFGMHQLMDQTMWLSLIPAWVVSLTGLTAKTIVILNGLFEIIMAVLLAIGFQIRIVAVLLSLHLLTIIGDLGMTAVGIRDVGLFFATLSIAFHGADEYSYDTLPTILI